MSGQGTRGFFFIPYRGRWFSSGIVDVNVLRIYTRVMNILRQTGFLKSLYDFIVPKIDVGIHGPAIRTTCSNLVAWPFDIEYSYIDRSEVLG